MVDLAQFEWPVSAAGYYWESRPPTEIEPALDRDMSRDPVLVPRPDDEEEGPRWCEPLEVPGLYRRFARIKLTPKAMLRFANAHGLLTEGRFAWWNDAPGAPGPCRVEPLLFWAREISAFRELLNIWDLVNRKDVGGLQRHIIWRRHPDRVVAWRRGHDSVADDSLGHGFTDEAKERLQETHEQHVGVATTLAWSADLKTAPLKDRWEWNDVLEPARYYVFREVNQRLSGHTSPVIDPFEKGRIFLQPDFLLTALYVQFAMDLAEWSRLPKVCVGCGIFFPPVHGRQKFCDEHCRKRHWWNKEDRDGGKTRKR